LLNGVSLLDDAQRLIASGETDQAEVFRALGFQTEPIQTEPIQVEPIQAEPSH
jgi:hypothetical protein